MSVPLNIVFLADHLGYRDGIAHGVTTYCHTVFPRLTGTNLRLKCLFLGPPYPAAVSLQDAGIEVKFLDRPKHDFTVGHKVARVLGRWRPRIVHVTQQKSTALARLLAPFYNYRLVAHLHDFEPVPSALRLAAALTRRPDMMLCVTSKLIPTAVEQYGIPSDRCKVLPNGLDLSLFRRIDASARQDVRVAFGIPQHAPVIGMAVRLFPDKRPENFIVDARGILKRCPDVHFLIAGDGPERAPCERLASQLGIAAQTHIVGYYDDVRSLISACDVVALYSLVEACPYAAIEALALGKPVIGFDAGGMSEIVETGITGFLAETGRPGELVDRAVDLIQNVQLRRAMSENCIRNVEKFSIDRHVAALYEVYTGLVGGNFDARKKPFLVRIGKY
ncbi:MAG: glycosyltransferase family 4 protein [Gammaproteobacteria bacterium]